MAVYSLLAPNVTDSWVEKKKITRITPEKGKCELLRAQDDLIILDHPEALANCVVINVTSTHIHNHSPIIFHCKLLKPQFMGLHVLLIKMTDSK